MHFTALSAYKVRGIVQKADSPDLSIYNDTATGLRATITGDLNRHWNVLDRQSALASMLLQGQIQEPLDDHFNENLSTHIDTIRKQRTELGGGDAALVVEVQGEVEANLPEFTRKVEDFLLCFDAYDKKALYAKTQSQVSSVITALRIGGSGRFEFETIGHGSYLSTDEGTVVHSYSMEMGTPSVYVSSPLTDAQIIRVADDINLILKSGDIERVVRLHAHSLGKASDNFRAFIAAWSALEILIGKLFPIYQGLLSLDLRKVSAAPGLRAYLDRVASVMEGKYSLTDKFAVMTVFLDDEGKADEVNTFRNLKKFRDRLSHGESIPDDTLPTREVQMLFEKYARNHVRKDA